MFSMIIHEYMFCHLLTNQKFNSLVVMETKVSTPVLWLFWKLIDGIRLDYVLVFTRLI